MPLRFDDLNIRFPVAPVRSVTVLAVGEARIALPNFDNNHQDRADRSMSATVRKWATVNPSCGGI
jgi:hypothetical protein